MSESTYKEVQRMDTLWPLLIFTLTVVFNWVLYFYFSYTDLNVFYGSMLSIGLLTSFFFSLRLYTRIDSEGVHYRFFPFHFSWRSISWKEISKKEIRQYKPWSEYGGWGLRWGKSGWAYTISGKTGLQLILKNNKKLLIGTSNSETLIDVVKQYKSA